MDIVKTLMEELSLKEFQVKNVIELLDDGNTVPFIARYRKEKTGSLDDATLRTFYDRLSYLRSLDERREEVISLIDGQGKLTEELRGKILSSKTLSEIDDIYRPYRPKRRTRATIAKEKGLEELANLIFAQESLDYQKEAEKYISEEKEVLTIDEALAGAMDIIAEEISDDAELRKKLRKYIYQNASIASEGDELVSSPYQMYCSYEEPVRKILSHRVLALNRGEKEKFLKVSLKCDADKAVDIIKAHINLKETSARPYLELTARDSYERLIFPSLERELRSSLTDVASEKAIEVFKENLKNLLMQPPLKNFVVLGLDPAYRTGCKVAVVDETGKVLDHAVIFPTPPQLRVDDAKKVLKRLIEKYNVTLISIGNGTASRETESFTAELISEMPERKLSYAIVNEAGASVYSASELGTEEFPEFEPAIRSAVSIARRLQDPLSELVKIDPKAIGVGQYQHDMPQKRLGEALGFVVEDCVNAVGVDLNTASVPLLSAVSGINKTSAKNIVAYREEVGSFKNRKELLNVSRMGKKAFEQSAGFMRIMDGDNALDNTGVHPESYETAKTLLQKIGFDENDLRDQSKLSQIPTLASKIDLKELARETNSGEETLKDIIKELSKPGRDPRDEAPKPILKSDVLDISHLKPDMILQGTVRNVIDFGAFVDIGVHQDGLVHISQICDRYIRHPSEVLKIGDVVKVKVLSIDEKRGRISLTMKGI